MIYIMSMFNFVSHKQEVMNVTLIRNEIDLVTPVT